MAEQLFYPEDTVSLRSDGYKIGLVDQCNLNPRVPRKLHACSPQLQVETHDVDPTREYSDALTRHSRVSTAAYDGFLRTGIPPRGTVLVTWAQLPWSYQNETTLISESDIKLVDRAVLAGDVVKRSPRDAMSGTIIQASTKATLLQSLRWPRRSNFHPESFDLEADFAHNFPSSPVSLLQDVPVGELKWTNQYQVDDFVIYRGWVGRIEAIAEEPSIRLRNNSVVIPQVPDHVRQWSNDSSYHVGDFVSARKANLRRGRWIYGAFDANVEPEGFVAEVHQTLLLVEWLDSRPCFDAAGPRSSSRPDAELGLDELESGEVHLYDRSNRPSREKSKALRRINFELMPGDRVRFRDIAGAAVKYDGTARDGNQDPGRLDRIPRTDTLGYDINIFMVISMRTTADVHWQDGTISHELDSTSLFPCVDVATDDEVWPGELVTLKSTVEDGDADGVRTLTHVGVVQKTHAQDRVAMVRWMPAARVQVTAGELAAQLPGSRTGALDDEETTVSLYEISRVPDLVRRLGDFVAIIPSAETGLAGAVGDRYDDVRAVLESRTEDNAWFGEVINLGLDGFLTVRLGAANPVKDVKVPWECTHTVWTSDEELTASEDEDDDDDDDDDDAMSEMSTAFPTTGAAAEDLLRSIIPGLGGDYMPTEPDREGERGDPAGSSESSWETEDDLYTDDENDGRPRPDEDPTGMDVDEGVNAAASLTAATDHDGDVDMGSARESSDAANSTSEKPPPSSFSYSALLKGNRKPFDILEGPLPADHKWSDASHNLDGKRLRRIQKEHKILSTSLPEGAYVRTWESSLDCLRLLLIGPLDTPYELAPFVFDFYLDSLFPDEPPQVHFHSWTNGQGPCNPNLYQDGKVCLSLLGTWPGNDQNDSWTPKSTVLQVIVSLLGLVLVKEPYYNEAGFEVRVGSVESQIPSKHYSERAFLRTRAFITHALRHPVSGLDDDIRALYLTGPTVLSRAITSAIDVVRNSRLASAGGLTSGWTVSAGALISLVGQIEELIGVLRDCTENGEAEAAGHRAALQAARDQQSGRTQYPVAGPSQHG